MRTRTGLARTGLAALVLACLTTLSAAQAPGSDPLRDGFVSPPDEARPRTWWHWVSGNISRDGITKDLEAMKRVGIAEAQLFNVDQGPAGPVRTMSTEWMDLTQHAIREANRIGVQLTIHNCPGWSTSGGPWVKPEQSMQFVYTSQAIVNTGDVEVTLPKGKNDPSYRDIAVLAFPTPNGDANRPTLASASDTIKDAGNVLDDDPESKATITWPASERPTLQFDFADATSIGRVEVVFDRTFDRLDGEIQGSEDGKAFKPLARFDRGGLSTFAPATVRSIRIVLNAPADAKDHASIRSIRFAGARLDNVAAKAAYRSDVNSNRATPWPVAANQTIPADKVINLTDKLDANGKLKWTVPAGTWTILRVGHASNGQQNGPAVPEARGLESDKLSADAVEAHFNNGMIGQILEKAGEHPALTGMLTDSWEANCLNWTPAMREQFQKRCGYDPIPWLPAMTGRVVGSVEQSERFLWDLRRTIADLIAVEHYGTLQKLANENGMKFYSEAPGIGMPTVADELQCKARTDIPMGEFWLDGHGSADVKEAASAAHITGKQWVAVESFTAGTAEARWRNDPFGIKALGDKHFCLGMNRVVFHRYAHQPDDRVPGVTMGPWGLNFERSQTWWEQGKGYLDYIARVQWMLSRGTPVNDVLYFYGEGAPVTLKPRSELKPTIPQGYDYDGIDAETLATARVQGDEIVLPSGTRYHMLVIADSDRMTPRTLERIEALAQSGATIVGTKPTKSPSLSGYPDADVEVAKKADSIWKRDNVIADHSVAEVFARTKLAPDFASDAAPSRVMSIHRREGDAEIYFVSNQKYEPATIDCTFRVSGKVPELWHADTGAIEPAPAWREHDGVTTLPLSFAPAESVFVVFRGATKPGDWVTMTRKPADPTKATGPTVQVLRALYQTGDADSAAFVARDVTRVIADAVASGKPLRVTNNTMGGDPKFGEVKSLVVDYVVDGKPARTTIGEGDDFDLPRDGVGFAQTFELRRDAAGKTTVLPWQSGPIDLTLASGKTWQRSIATGASTRTIEGPWDIAFPPNRGAPDHARFDELASWTESPDPGVKFFSGTATYTKTFNADAVKAGDVVEIDLGDVKNLAEVTLNGKPLGILWKKPFRVDVSGALKAGENQLEVKITNLWPNRLIGDAGLPEAKRVTWTTFQPYKADAPLLPSGLIGPVTLQTVTPIEVTK